jgi:anti-anti-sigma factor
MLSVDMKVLRTGCMLVCRGDVTGGKEAEYLFNLITREDKGDVIVDLGGVSAIDNQGVAVIIAAYTILRNCGRKLFLKSPSTDVVRALQERAVEVLYYSEPRYAAAPTSRVQ